MKLTIEQVWEGFHKTHEDRYRNLLMEHTGTWSGMQRATAQQTAR
jgi:hypothetical protein